MAGEERGDGAPRADVPEQQGEETRHRRGEGREMRASTKGSQKRTRGTLEEELKLTAYRRDVRDDPVNDDEVANDKWAPAGPNDEGDDTRERKKREAITETIHKRSRY